MGLYTNQPDYPRIGDATGRGADRRKTPPRLRGRGVAAYLIAALLSFWLAAPLTAEILTAAPPIADTLTANSRTAKTLRIATYHCGLSRKGPGLVLRDILKGEAQAEAAAQVILRSAPDILLLTQFDYDHGHIAALAFRDRLAAAGLHYPYLVTLRPNTGRPTGLDLDGDGRLDEPEDAHGYGVFSGQGGMVILSRLPVQRDAVRDFPTLLWKDLPGQTMPTWMPTWTAKGAADVLRLSSVGHWVVPIETPSGPLTLLAFHAQTPVFDGPEDRNGHRNHNEILFWRQFLDGHFGPAPDARFALLGTINLDPVDGEGQHGAINSLLSDPRFQDPAPRSAGGAAAGSEDQSGDPALDTVDWKEPVPGNLRVDYVLPSSDLRVLASGVDWPAPQDAGLEVVERASVHRLVWVDVDIGGS